MVKHISGTFSRLWAVLCFCICLQAARAAVPSAWLQPIPDNWSSMAVMARVHSNGSALKLPGSKVAVFYQGELRSVADYDNSDGYYFYNLSVRVGSATESGYIFKFYHPTEDKVYDLELPAAVSPMSYKDTGYGNFNERFEFEPLVLTLPPPPVVNPTVTVTLTPSTAKWKLDSGSWQTSGATVTTTAGSHTISYQAVTGYVTPSDETIELTEDKTYTKSTTYPPDNKATVTVTLTPSTAKWKLDSGSWQSSGATVTTTAGSHTISYQAVTGYITPSDETITLTAGQNYTKSTTYPQPKLKVTLTPSTAKWKLDSGSWQSSSTTVTTTAGSHTISYQAVTGYVTPSDETIELTEDKTYTKSTSYPQPKLKVTLTPSTAKWRLDSGSWQASGATVTTTAGSHTISYQAVTGYITPSNETIELTENKTYTKSTSYVPIDDPDPLVPDWEEQCDIQTAYNMTFATRVLLADGTEANAAGSLVGVFNGDVCCGFAELVDSPFGKVFEGMVYSNSTSVPGLAMKLYDAASREILDIWEILDFEADAQCGNQEEPMELHAGIKTVSWNLKTGWNWVAMNVLPADASLASLLGDYTATAGDQIKTSGVSSTYYDTASFTGWSPAMTLQPGVMYMVRRQAATAATVAVNGAPCGTDATLAVKAGWNWVGLFSGEESCALSRLSSTGGFANGDQLKSQSASATYYVSSTFTGWSGNLTELVAGQGYKLKKASAGTLSFSAATRGGEFQPFQTTTSDNAPAWIEQCDIQTAYNMTFAARVQRADGSWAEADGSLLGIFNGEACCGFGMLTPTPFGYSVYEGMVYSNSTTLKNLSMKLFDSSSGSVAAIQETLDFEADAQYGDQAVPVELTLTEDAFAVTVTGGWADKTAACRGETVTAHADFIVESGQWTPFMRFAGWDADGVELQDATALDAVFEMPGQAVSLTAQYEPVLAMPPETWRAAASDARTMTVFAIVRLPGGTTFTDADSLVACFDADGVCRGVGGIYGMSGAAVYCLQVNGAKEGGKLSLALWSHLTDERLDIAQSLEYASGARLGVESPLEWTTLYNLNDASNPDSPYYSPEIFGEDPAGTVFSMVVSAVWEASLIGYDFKLRLNDYAISGRDGYDCAMPPRVPPFAAEEYAHFTSADGVPLMLDSRPGADGQAVWALTVTVPAGRPAVIGWNSEGIPAGWEGRIEVIGADGAKAAEYDALGESSLTLGEAGVWRVVFTFRNGGNDERKRYSLKAGWNLITPTLELNGASLEALMAYEPMVMDAVSMAYTSVEAEDIRPGQALWLWSDASCELTLEGTAVADWSFAPSAGWSFAGAVRDVPAEELPEGVTDVWCWTASGYRRVTGGLKAGSAYWIFMAEK